MCNLATMRKRNFQLNKGNQTAYEAGHIFVSPMAKIISFSRDYLKHIVLQKA